MQVIAIAGRPYLYCFGLLEMQLNSGVIFRNALQLQRLGLLESITEVLGICCKCFRHPVSVKGWPQLIKERRRTAMIMDVHRRMRDAFERFSPASGFLHIASLYINSVHPWSSSSWRGLTFDLRRYPVLHHPKVLESQYSTRTSCVHYPTWRVQTVRVSPSQKHTRS